MTARLAFSYDRDVFALPGRIDDIRSQGCNTLIKSKIAEPLTSIPEFLESLGLKGGGKSSAASEMETLNARYRGKVSEDRLSQMSGLLTTIRQKRGITVEELAEFCALEYSRAVELCTCLELDGFINIDLLQRCSISPKV